MKKFQAKRLIALDELMLNFDFDNYVFNISYWIGNGIWYKPTAKDVRMTKNQCGTACCAAGHGVLQIPSWKRHLKLEYGNIHYKDEKINFDFNTTTGRLAHFLGIEYDEALYIFLGKGYFDVDDDALVKPRDVSIHIRKVLQKYGYEGYPL